MMEGKWPAKAGTATHEIGAIHEEIEGASCDRCDDRVGPRRWEHLECLCGWVWHNKPGMPWLVLTFADHLKAESEDDPHAS